MKKIKTILLLFITLTVVSQNGEVTIGNPSCGGAISSNAPAKYDYVLQKENSWSKMLYTASQIGASGKLKGIAFFADCTVSSDCTFETATKQKVYIKEVDESTFSSAAEPNLATYTLVYDGSVTWKRGKNNVENSKTQIVFQNEFEYSGNKNLVIYFLNENNKPLGDFTTTCGSSPSFLWNDSGEKNIAYEFFKEGQKTGNGTLNRQLPIIRFYFGDIDTQDYTASAEKTLITANPNEIKADGTSTSLITVQLYNKAGTLLTLGGQTIVLETNAGKLSNVTDNNNGTYTAKLTSSTSIEIATITGKVNWVDIVDTEQVHFTGNGSAGGGTTSNPKNLVQGFSPNGDGKNDTWRILPNVFVKYPNNRLVVFNRQGNKVYQAAPYKNDWNGESDGKITVSKSTKLPMGAYYFIFETGVNNQVFKGWLYINY